MYLAIQPQSCSSLTTYLKSALNSTPRTYLNEDQMLVAPNLDQIIMSSDLFVEYVASFYGTKIII